MVKFCALRISKLNAASFPVTNEDTWYLSDDKYRFTNDAPWFDTNDRYTSTFALAENNKPAIKPFTILEEKLKKMETMPLLTTSYTGWTYKFEFVFARRDGLCSPF